MSDAVEPFVKKILLAVIAVVLIALAVVLAAPSFIDWNNYRQDVAAVIAEATGRNTTIAGDLDFSLLPAPRLIARKISIASIEGAVEPAMLRAAELHMELAAGPLLRGRIKVRSLTVVDPVLTLETTADGRRSWEFTPMETRGEKGAAGPMSMTFDTVTVARGSLVWRNAGSDPHRLDAIDAILSQAGPKGPVRIRGQGTYSDLPIALVASVGRPGPDGRAQVLATLDVAGATGRLTVTGWADMRAEAASGSIRFTAPDAARLARALTADSITGLPARNLEIESAFVANRNVVATRDITVRYGNTVGTGLARYAADEIPALAVALEFGSVDFDALFPESGRAGPPGDLLRGTGPVTLPTGLTADFDVSVKAARWRGGVVRDLGGTVRLQSGALQIERIAAKLPGATNVTLSGNATPADGGFRLDGDLAVVSDNLRAALVWAGAAENTLPADRMRGFSYTSRITVLPESVHLAKIAARLDATNMTGAAIIARRARPSFGLRLALDRIGLDAYLPQAAVHQPGDFDGLPETSRFDANINLSAGDLTWRGKTLQDVVLDARLFGGNVDLRALSVGDLGGAAFSVSGRIDDLPAAPRGDLEFTLEGADAARFAQFAEAEAGPLLRRLGRFRLQAHAAGDAENAKIDGNLDIAGGRIAATGTVSGPPDNRSFGFSVTASHPDGDRVLGLLAPDRGDGKIGPMSAALQLAGTAETLTVSGFGVSLGGMSVDGRMDAVIADGRPKAVVVLSADLLDFDRLLPAAAWMARDAGPPPRGNARWSRETIDMSVLRDLDLGLSIRSDSIRHSGLDIDDAELSASLSGGVLIVDRLTGNLAGGRIEAAGRIDAAQRIPDVEFKITGRGVQAGRTLDALAGTDRIQGPVSLDLNLSLSGRSAFELVSSLQGAGSISGELRAPLTEDEQFGEGEAVNAGVILGDEVSEILDAGDAIDTLLRAFAGAPATVSGDIRIDNGIATTENLVLEGPRARALTTGFADFPGWRLDTTTKLRRSEDGEIPYMVAGMKGPIDGPNVRVSGTVTGESPAEAPVPEASPVISVEPVEAE